MSERSAARVGVTVGLASIAFALNVAKTIVGIGGLILLHEFGHFVVGRLCGVKAEAFSIGFPPTFARWTPALGVCQWFNFEDHRLHEAVMWLRRLGVKHVRTGLSWAESFFPNALDWFDRQMGALEEFDVTVTFSFTPWQRGILPNCTSPPVSVGEFADFCAAMVRRYATTPVPNGIKSHSPAATERHS